MGGHKSQTIGYIYRMGVHYIVCHGPVDELVGIKVGDRSAWSGSVTADSTIAIDAPDLFGGKHKEGGVQGSLDVMMGGSTQGANAYLTAQQNGLQPGYRGLFGLVYRGIVATNNPYPKAWAFRVRKILQGWAGGTAWYPATAAISLAGGTISAMNPAHILLKVATHPVYGMGYPLSAFDLVSFTAAADALFAENFGLCMAWTQPEPVQAFLQRILDHIGANLAQDRSTGLIRLHLIRDDYTPANLPLFGAATGLLSIEDDNTAAAGVAVNEVIVAWHDPITNRDGSDSARNLADIEATGAVVSETRQYPGLPTADLALRIAQRDVNISTSHLHRYRLRLDRRAQGLLIGDVFRISNVIRGITNLVLRAIDIDYGSPTDNVILIRAMQDVFGLPLDSHITPQPSAWVAPDRSPRPVLQQSIFEAPYVQLAGYLSAADLAALPDDSGYLSAAGKKPGGVPINYSLQTRIGTEAYADRTDEDFAPTATLAAAVPVAAAPVALTLQVGSRLDQVNPGALVAIDAELLRCDAIDPLASTATLARGCADTVPQAHAAGAIVWFLSQFTAGDPRQYVLGETIDARLITRAGTGSLDPTLATVAQLLLAERQVRPYPPGALMINGSAYPATITGTLVLAWAHRDRLIQDDQLIDTTAATIGPESGTTYNLRLYNENNVLSHTETAIAGTGYTWSTEADDSLIPSGGGSTITESFLVAPLTTSYAVRDGAPTISWDSVNLALTVAGSTVQNFVSWDLWGDFTGDINFEMDWVFLSDAAGRLHQGMFLAGGAGATGYRIYHLDTGWGISRWNAGTEVTIATFADIPIVIGSTYTLSIIRDGTGLFTISLGGVLVGTATDLTYPALRPGFFVYGSSMNVLEIRAALLAYRLNNSLRFELESSRAGLISRQMHNVLVTRV